MPNQTQGRYWAIAAVVFFVALWYLGSVMLPFLVGGAVAYFLDPVADRLERLGLSRALATLVISVAAFVLVVLIVLALIPVLVQQLTSLINLGARLGVFGIWRDELADLHRGCARRGLLPADGLGQTRRPH